MLDEEGHIPHNIDVVDVVFLLTEVVLHQTVLPITHQPQHLQGQLDVGRVLEAKQLCGLLIDACVGVNLGWGGGGEGEGKGGGYQSICH